MRWSKVSGSKNADESYRLRIQDDAEAYSFICVCKRVFGTDYDEGEDGSNEDEEEKDDKKGKQEKRETYQRPPSCDGGKTCLCHKPATEHPGNIWTVSRAGFQKFITSTIQGDLRCPDLFNMYVYNDYHGYGIVQVVQNTLLDFDQEKEKDNWKEQWAICEAIILFFQSGHAMPFFMIDDSQGMKDLCDLLRIMFLTALASLERHGLLKPDSEVKNLGVMMGQFLRFQNICDSFPEGLDTAVVAYAAKHNIQIQGLSDVRSRLESIRESDEEVVLPASDAESTDPWDFNGKFLDYIERNAPAVGGDSYDVTTWTCAERKRKSFTGKDPFSKKDRDALKEGMVLQLG